MRTDTSNPYVGLRPFEMDESILFFGGSDQTTEMLQRLHKHHFVAVVGSSGCGKSSLLRAGLIPALKGGYLVENSDHWLISIMKPGQSPLYNLAASILLQIDPATKTTDVLRLVQKIKEEGADALSALITPAVQEQHINFFLLVDQFEELFRFAMEKDDAAKKDEAIDFVNIILELSQQRNIPFYVVITMRSDFIGDCAQFYGLPEAMNESQYLVPRLNRLQMKSVIEGPAKLYGGKINPALTSRLLNDLAKVKDELPLLQHVLMRIWDFEANFNKSGELDLEDYERIGGIENALSNHADEALQGMGDADLVITKKIFQALTAIDESGRKIRRPVLLSQLAALTGASENKLLEIIHLFIKDERSFLVIDKAGESSDSIIDISHESLIRQWKALGKWVDEEGESTSNYLQLLEAAKMHRQNRKDYLTGSELLIAQEWYNKSKPVAIWANRYKEGFDESIRYLKESEAEQTARADAEKKRRRDQRYLFVALIVLLFFLAAGAIGFSIYFNGLKKEAEKQKTTTENQYAAFLLHAKREEKIDENPTIALRLEEAAFEKLHDSIFERASCRAYYNNVFYKIIAHHKNQIYAVAFSPDGKTIVTGCVDHVARIWNLNGDLLKELKGHTDTVWAVCFSPDGKYVLTGSGDKTACLWNLEGNMLQRFKGHLNTVWAVNFSPDGKKILTGSADSTACLWDLKGNNLHKFTGHKGDVYSIAFSHDGKKILTGSLDTTTCLWTIEGKRLRVFSNQHKAIFSVTFSPDQTKILTGSLDKTACLWDLNGHILQEFNGHTDAISGLAFSPDGKAILTGSWDKTARLWDLKGNILQEFKGHTDAISAVAFMPDGGSIVTASVDSTARLWQLKGRLLQELTNHNNLVSAAAFSPDGKTMLTGSWDGLTRLWDTNGNILKLFQPGYGAVTSVAFSPDGTNIIIGFADRAAVLYDVKGNILNTFNQMDVVSSVAFSPNGQHILTGCYDGTARIWALDGDVQLTIKAHDKVLWMASFSPDGTKILTCSSDKTARLWNLKGDSLQTFTGHSDTVWAAKFSPDGTKIITGSSDKTARLWDLKGNLLQKFEHPALVNAVAFSPDGKTVLTGSTDRAARLWNLKGNIVQEWKGHTEWISCVAISPDGKTILTGSGDKTSRLWEVAMPLKDFLKSNWLEPLSAEQKKNYGID